MLFGSGCDLPSFCLVLSIIFFAYLHTGILAFGPSIGKYLSFWQAFAFQLEITLGKVKARPIKELAEVVPIFKHVLVVSLLFSITMNFFVSTLNDAFAEAKTAVMGKETEEVMTAGQPVNIIVDKLCLRIVWNYTVTVVIWKAFPLLSIQDPTKAVRSYRVVEMRMNNKNTNSKFTRYSCCWSWRSVAWNSSYISVQIKQSIDHKRLCHDLP